MKFVKVYFDENQYLKFGNFLYYNNKKIDNNIIKSKNCILESNKICKNCIKLKNKLNYLKSKLIKFENIKFENQDCIKNLFKNFNKFESKK
jgi:hypothetical protein